MTKTDKKSKLYPRENRGKASGTHEGRERFQEKMKSKQDTPRSGSFPLSRGAQKSLLKGQPLENWQPYSQNTEQLTVPAGTAFGYTASFCQWVHGHMTSLSCYLI